MTPAPGAFTVDTYHSVDDLDPQGWDGLAGVRGFYRSLGWLRHAEATADPAPVYLAAVANGRLLAGVPAYPLTTESPFVFCRPDYVLSQRWPAAEPWLATLMPTLACGGRNPGHTRVGLAPGLAGAPALIAGMVAAAQDRARRLGLASVSFMYVDDDDHCLRTVLHDAGYLRFPAETAYRLPVIADSFEDYLMRLPSRARTAARRDLRALARANVTYRVEPASHALVARMSVMEAALYARYGTPTDPDALARINASILARTGSARVVMAYRDGRSCGFVTTFTYGNELYARQVGFDYAVKADVPVYFGVLFYELIRMAQAEGLTHIYYGVGSDHEKRSRGATPIAQHTYVRALDPGAQSRLMSLV